jgi:hypothetical protein
VQTGLWLGVGVVWGGERTGLSFPCEIKGDETHLRGHVMHKMTDRRVGVFL